MTDLLADIEPEELNDSKLAWSSIEYLDRVYNPTRKRGGGRSITKCLFCGSEWKTGGPRDIRAHLDPGSVRYRTVCIPKPEHADRFAKVSKEVQERRRKKEVQERKRKSPAARISEGLADLGASSSPSSSSSLSEPERAALIEECDQAWARCWAKNAWAFRAVDCPYFREALRLSAILGDDYLNADQTKIKLPHRTTFVSKTMKQGGDELDRQIKARVRKATNKSGGTIISDGCRSTSKDACINVLLTTAAGTQFLSSVAATEVTKDMKYIANLIIEHIEEIGSDDIVAVIMDGACEGAFKFITEKFPHIQCFICPTHSLDRFMSNICSGKDTITVRGQGDFEWGEDLFSRALKKVKFVVKTVTRHQFPLDAYRRVKNEANAALDQGAEQYKDLIKYCDTRFMSQLLMAEQYLKSITILERLLVDTKFTSWLRNKSRSTKEKVPALYIANFFL